MSLTFLVTSIAMELWPHEFCPCSGEQHLHIPSTSPDLASTGHKPSFFHLMSKRRFLFSQSSLAPHLLDFQFLGIDCSCAPRSWWLKSDQHWRTPGPSKAFSWGTFIYWFPEQPEVSSSHVHGWSFAGTFPSVTRDFKLDGFMVAVAKTATNLHSRGSQDPLCWQAMSQGRHLSKSALLAPVPWSCHPGVSGIQTNYVKIC